MFFLNFDYPQRDMRTSPILDWALLPVILLVTILWFGPKRHRAAVWYFYRQIRRSLHSMRHEPEPAIAQVEWLLGVRSEYQAAYNDPDSPPFYRRVLRSLLALIRTELRKRANDVWIETPESSENSDR